MPKFGLKCFLGSFILSLAAVFAATKAYLFYPSEFGTEDENVANIKVRNIDLFANNNEEDLIRLKYEKLMAEEDEKNDALDVAADLRQVEQLATAENVTSEILFAPTEDDEQVAETAQLTEIEDVAEKADQSLETVTNQADASDDEFKITDAAEATMFEIPLTHSFAPQDSKVAVTEQAENNQLALADGNVKVDNLGVESKTTAAKKEVPSLDDDDPWEVAEVANKNITRNQRAETVKETTTGNSVPYKMQKNILIPIPDEIANDKNLTPQFSSSAENIKLEEELRRKHGRPPLNASESEVKAKENSGGISTKVTKKQEDEPVYDSSDDDSTEVQEEGGSLTDSIAAWFSSDRKKAKDDNSQKEKSEDSSKQNESSLFRKLLGLGVASKDNIAPTELKLSFQANRAEISGQTLEWIKAFSENVVKYDDVAIEIRIDRSASYELQQKRLNLLYKILANNGVEYRKINIIFTDREPNSFIIRNVRYVTKEEKAEVVAKGKSPWY